MMHIRVTVQSGHTHGPVHGAADAGLRVGPAQGRRAGLTGKVVQAGLGDRLPANTQEQETPG